MFDLPTETKNDRRAATQFRNNLLKDGYNMLQYSIYQRICPNLDQTNKYLRKLEAYKPKIGRAHV